MPAGASQNDDSSATPPQDGSFTLIILAVVFGLISVIALKVFRNIRNRQRLEEYRLDEERRRLAEARRLVAKYWRGNCLPGFGTRGVAGHDGEQLIDSRGSPSDVGREIIREKTRETWKYQQTGRNRFRERIYLENGIVIRLEILNAQTTARAVPYTPALVFIVSPGGLWKS